MALPISTEEVTGATHTTILLDSSKRSSGFLPCCAIRQITLCALHDLGEQLLAQHVVYAEITFSVGVMLLRHQNVERNFEAIVRRRKRLRCAD